MNRLELLKALMDLLWQKLLYPFLKLFFWIAIAPQLAFRLITGRWMGEVFATDAPDRPHAVLGLLLMIGGIAYPGFEDHIRHWWNTRRFRQGNRNV